jgi:hypothetical protein
MVSGSVSLPCSGFFSPFPHGTGSLSVSQEYLALADGPAGFIQGFSCPALLRIPLSLYLLPIPGCHRLWPSFPTCSNSILQQILWSYNPIQSVNYMVWANARSLAATSAITIVFSSSGYLDVSVPRVCLLADNTPSVCWVAPFGYLRINLYVPVPAAFRSLSRPSSPLRA